MYKNFKSNYKKKSICGYSGSLIQQNFGEDIIEHGYLVWNLANKQVDEINVYNAKGQIVSIVSKPKTNSFNLLNFEKGIYYIVFLKEKKIVLTKKVLKE